MCREAASAYAVTGIAGLNGSSQGSSSWTEALPRPTSRWVDPYAIRATSQSPASIAARAWATWNMNDDPPTLVASV